MVVEINFGSFLPEFERLFDCSLWLPALRNNRSNQSLSVGQVNIGVATTNFGSPFVRLAGEGKRTQRRFIPSCGSLLTSHFKTNVPLQLRDFIRTARGPRCFGGFSQSVLEAFLRQSRQPFHISRRFSISPSLR